MVSIMAQLGPEGPVILNLCTHNACRRLNTVSSAVLQRKMQNQSARPTKKIQ